jgi:predicted transcriptional regulator
MQDNELDLEIRIMNYLQEHKQWQSEEQLAKKFHKPKGIILVALHSLLKKEMVVTEKLKWKMKREDSPEQ